MLRVQINNAKQAKKNMQVKKKPQKNQASQNMRVKPQKNQASQKPCEKHAKKSPGKLNSQTKLKQINTRWCPVHNDVIHLPRQNMQSCKSRKAKIFILFE